MVLPELFEPPLPVWPPPVWPPSRELGLLVGAACVVGAAGGAADEIVTEGVLVGVGEIVTEGVLVGDGVAVVAAAPALGVGPSEPAAPCGHQTTRQADRASIAATTMRARFVRVLLTTSSKDPMTEGEFRSSGRYYRAVNS
jgi:predicted cobalt transporter CbtA